MNENRCSIANKRKLSIFGIFSAGFTFMAWPAQRLKVAVVVRAAMSFRDDMVDGFSRARPAIAQTFLTDVPVTFKDAGADDIPFAAVTTLVAAHSSLMLLPAFITMRLAVARTVNGGVRTSAFAAGTRDSVWHA